MATAATGVAPATQVARRPFSVAEYYRLAETGILQEDERLELLDGEIIRMSPINSSHAGHVKQINGLLGRRLGRRAILGIQDPILLDDYSEPQPDISVLRPRADSYTREHPTPADVLLLIEVADTSLAYDRDVKIPRYARALIREVWLVDLVNRLIILYAEPAEGQYRVVRQFRPGEQIVSATIPNLTLAVDDIFR